MSSQIELMIGGFLKSISAIDFNSKCIADLGCGYGRWGHIIRSEVDRHGQNAYIIGCDIYRPCLLRSKKYSPYDDLIVCDITRLPFRQKSISIIFALEVIEHLQKSEAQNTLKALEQCVQETIIISTPWGYFPQGEIRNNIRERHLSSWKPEDFEKYGYRTLECGIGRGLERIGKKLKIYRLLHKTMQAISKEVEGGNTIFAQKKLADEALENSNRVQV